MRSDTAIRGVAAFFDKGVYAGVLPDGTEMRRARIFAPHCFDSAVNGDSAVELLYEHACGQRGEVIAATADGTLALDVRGDALVFSAWPASSVYAARAELAIRSGKVKGCSIGYKIIRSEPTFDRRYDVIIEATLAEISLVSRPAVRETWCEVFIPERVLL
jgi:HK97 family phage prohead protease